MMQYEITPEDDGWRMVVTQDGVEIAGGFAEGEDGFDFLLAQAEAICGIS